MYLIQFAYYNDIIVVCVYVVYRGWGGDNGVPLRENQFLLVTAVSRY